MALQESNFPTIKPELTLDFANSRCLDPRITFARNSTGTYVDERGVIQTAPVNVARFDHNPTTGESLGLLVEEPRTNSIRNNTMVGAVAGTPGTSPTNWGVTVSNAELTSQIIGVGSESGISYIDIKISGTVTASRSLDLRMEEVMIASASSGQVWTESIYLKQVGGSQSNIAAIYLQANTYTNVGAYVTTPWLTAVTVGSGSLITQRFTATGTLSGATTAYIAPFIKISTATTGAVDFTLRIGLPQLEQGAFATSVIPTTTAAATRSADVASITGTAFSGWYNAAQGALYAEYSIPFDSSTSLFPIIAGFSDSTFNNAAIHYNRTIDDGRRALVRSGGTSSFDQSNAGAYVYGQVGKQAFAYTSSEFAFSAIGVAPAVSSSITWPTVDRFGMGNTVFVGGANSYLNGTIRRLVYWRQRLPNAALQTLTSS